MMREYNKNIKFKLKRIHKVILSVSRLFNWFGRDKLICNGGCHSGAIFCGVRILHSVVYQRQIVESVGLWHCTEKHMNSQRRDNPLCQLWRIRGSKNQGKYRCSSKPSNNDAKKGLIRQLGLKDRRIWLG